MSQLKARCIDQVLTFENTPVITSGNVNYDSIMFDFCSSWDEFIKTAIFYRSEDEVFYQLLDEANTCIIPAEVLKEKGDVYIGVFGVNGDTTLTSQVLKYKIMRGAITEDLKPADPTPDIYSQILSRYNHYDERLAYFEERFNGSVGDAEKLGGHEAEYFERLGHKFNIVGEVADMNTVSAYTTGIVYKTALNVPSDMSDGYGLFYTIGYSKEYQIQRIVCSKIYERIIAQNKPSEWKTVATTADLAKYLPLTGGTTSGDIEVKGASASRLKATSLDGKYNMSLVATSDGYTGLYDTINGAWLVQHKPDGTNTFNGTASGNVASVNGTAYLASHGGFTIQRTGGAVCAPKYVGNGNTLGYLGFSEADKPIFIDTNGSYRDILHTGNMADHVLPKTGGTVGNGSDTAVPLVLTRKNGNYTELGFSGSDGTLGYLGFSSADNPVFENATRNNAYPLLHTGNSAKVHIGTSAPSDTSGAWIDTSE